MTFEIQVGTKIFKKISSKSGEHGMANGTTSFVSMVHAICDEHGVNFYATDLVPEKHPHTGVNCNF
jgi:hypothetical protein